MKKRSLVSQESGLEALSLSDLSRHVSMWLMAGDIANHSRQTLALRRIMTDKLLWFLRVKGHEVCGLDELRYFFHYLRHGHKEPGGRWGNPRLTEEVSPRTIRDYHCHLKTLSTWLVTEGVLPSSPMDRIPVPIVRQDQPSPFTDEQVERLLAAARRTQNPRRDEAALWFLFDCGLRAAELCALRFEDIDFQARRCTVEEGKGRKRRMVPFGKQTYKALYNYLKAEPADDDGPLFRSDRGENAGGYLTPSGLLRMIKRVGKVARVPDAHPHKFRHSFACSFLKNGGNQFTLMEMLGHTNPKMTSRYVQFAQADIEAQHRAYSPGDRLRGGRK